MRTDGEMFARRRKLYPSRNPHPWHYMVTDPTEPGHNKLTACGVRVGLAAWELTHYSRIAGEHTGQEHEGVLPFCRNCKRVQNREWNADAPY